MRHSIFALPALLRPALLLASASQHAFSVNDDLFAFPHYEVKFADDYVTELQAQAHILSHEDPELQHEQAFNQIGKYQPSEGDGVGEDAEEPKMVHKQMILEGQRYLCSIPQVAKPDLHQQQQQAANDTVSKAEKELELARAADRGWELLRGMQGNCVYFIAGWWSYKFCYNESVRQFHQLPPSRGVPIFPPVEDTRVDGFTLGMYTQTGDSDDSGKRSRRQEVEHRGAGKGELIQRGDSRFLVQRLEGGTKCDLTGKDRHIDIQFHCNPKSPDRISLIKETSTCAYLMVVQTPRLCQDVAFLPPQDDQPNAITCRPVLGDHEIKDYEKELKLLRAAEKEARIWEANPEAASVFLGDDGVPGKVVGDVVIGGHAFVPDDMKLKKSAIVGGGEETYIETVASSSGKNLGKEQLEKLGLGDPRAVEKLKRELEKMAKGEDWRLDVVDTPGGREYRGVLGSDRHEKDDGENNDEAGNKENEKREGSKEEYYHEEL